MRELILLPDDSSKLQKIYNVAISEAKTLIIATAFLTDWPIKVKLNNKCEDVTVLCGVGFGLTRKKALHDLLKWLPSKFKTELYASRSGSQFHPKILAWENHSGEFYLVVGSSNLSFAGVNENKEANLYARIDSDEWNKICGWIDEEVKGADLVNNEWVSQYVESTLKNKKPKKSAEKKIDQRIPVLKKNKRSNEHIEEHLLQMKKFNKIKSDYWKIIKECANESSSPGNEKFYNKMYEMRVNGENVFQRPTWVIKCKNSNWSETCRLLVGVNDLEHKLGKISEKNEHEFDSFLKKELDKLAKTTNPARNSWVSEQLCQLFPDHYPLSNSALIPWLRKIKLQAPRGSSFGAKYIFLTKVLRLAIRQKESQVKNFVELDAVAWTYTNNQKKQ